MKKTYKSIFIFCLLLMMGIHAFAQESDSFSPVDYVNPLMGTDSSFRLSNGNLYPAIALPWGMNFWSPQTGKMGSGWMYSYDAYKINGFKETHQPSPWMNDYGQFAVMPVTGKLKFTQKDRASWFSHKAETVKPYYYSVYLADYDVVTEIAPTERAAMFQFTFPKSDSSYIVVDATDHGSHIKVVPDEQKIVGYSTRNSGGVPANFHNYFVIKFDKPFEDVATWQDSTLDRAALEKTANHVGSVVRFKTAKEEQIHMKVASSFISPEQAELNLDREIGDKDFATLKQEGHDKWNDQLSRIKVEGGTSDQRETFYSCLYRMLLFPRKFYEYDANGDVVHYSPYNGKVENGYMFTDTGFWDTFRALFPFYNLMERGINTKIQKGLVNAYQEGGWLPEWASPGYRNVMIGNNSASIVADAYLKGLRGYDIDALYEAAKKGTYSQGPIEAVGRAGADYYNKLGYVPYDVGINENAARTLEYAYDDFALYKLAKALDRPQDEIDRFAKHSQNYRNLYDPKTHLMRGKNKDGSFEKPFNPFKWGDAFTEGNSWHYSWAVFHDPQGLINLMGGKDQFIAMLDSVWTMPPKFDASYYGGVIHEIREMQIMNMGQYAHGNQPIQHMIYLYDYAGQPWKAQYHIRQVLNKLYKPTPDGYCGDEDNGQTSAWYVFSAMGFYPVAPATNEYALGAPLFNKITLQLENGNKVVINAKNNGKGKPYIKSMKINGKSYDKNYLIFDDLMNGAKIDVTMSDHPNKNRGTDESDYPYSFSKEHISDN
ncbi:MAG TPA: GH92 family glycosyl hydrolase [Balneolaceae bacterium]|nr:GH92 family glycosyl hydrolase [Balneolaceae bacterium]